MPKHAAPRGGPIVALLVTVHHRTRRESRTWMVAQRRRPEGKANCTRTHRWTARPCAPGCSRWPIPPTVHRASPATWSWTAFEDVDPRMAGVIEERSEEEDVIPVPVVSGG